MPFRPSRWNQEEPSPFRKGEGHGKHLWSWSGSFFSGSDYTNYLYAIGQVQAAGWTVLGYTPTGYGTRSLSAVEGSVNLWASKYGTGQVGPNKLKAPVTGIFFDTACAGQKWTGSTGGGCASKPPGFTGSPASFFTDLTSYVHTRLGGFAVVNPGVQPVDSTFLTNPAVDDAVIAFENQYSVYTGSPAPFNNTGAVNRSGRSCGTPPLWRKHCR